MTKEFEFDPRTKLIIVLCLSTLAIVIKEIYNLIIILILTLIFAKFLRVDLKRSFRKVKGILYLFLGIAIVQSIFSPQGNTIISFGNSILLTTGGLERAIQFLSRMMIIIYSATIITTSSSREIIQGFVQWGLPYDIAFMVAIGIRFLPILTEEIKDSLISIQLRGVEINNIPIKQRLNLYSYIFTPILVSTISKAERLSTAIEMRGFRAYDDRTSYLVLIMSKWDYLAIYSSIIFTICYIVIYFFR